MLSKNIKEENNNQLIEPQNINEALFNLSSLAVIEFKKFFKENYNQNSSFYQKYTIVTSQGYEIKESRPNLMLVFEDFLKSFTNYIEYLEVKELVIEKVEKFNLAGKEIQLGSSIIRYDENLFFHNFLHIVLNRCNFHKNLDDDKLRILISEFVDFINKGQLKLKYVIFLGNINLINQFKIDDNIQLNKFTLEEMTIIGNNCKFNIFDDFEPFNKIRQPFIATSKIINIRDLIRTNNQPSQELNQFLQTVEKTTLYIEIINIACQSKIYEIYSKFLPIQFCCETESGSAYSIYQTPQFSHNKSLDFNESKQEKAIKLINRFNKNFNKDNKTPIWLDICLNRYSNPRNSLGLLNQIDLLLDNVSIIESLLSNGGSEVSFRISLLVGNIVGENKQERIDWQKKCKDIYDARSFFSHGCITIKEIEKFNKKYRDNLKIHIENSSIILDSLFDLIFRDDYITLIKSNRDDLMNKFNEEFCILN